MTVIPNNITEKPAITPCNPVFCGLLGATMVGVIDKSLLTIGKKWFSIQGFEQQSLKTLEQLKKTRSPFFFKLTKFSFICVIPTIEELFFRKLVRDSQLDGKPLADETNGEKIKRITINSALFALAHVQRGSTLRANALLGMSMFSSGVVYNSLMDLNCQGILSPVVAPVVAHMATNYLAIHFSFRKMH